MIIRAYHPADSEQIISLLRLNTPLYFSPEEEADLINYLTNHADHYFVIEEEIRISGCGGFNLTEDGKMARISWDIIHPDVHGKGLGSKLTVFRIIKIKEIEGIEMISVRTSQLVYRFYERFGFETKEIVKNYWAEGFDLYRMECDINATKITDQHN